MYTPQSRQSTKLSLQSSELGLPHPFTRKGVYTLPGLGGGGIHTRLRDSGEGAQFQQGDRHCGKEWALKIKTFLGPNVTRFACCNFFQGLKRSPFLGPTPSMALEMDLPESKSLCSRPTQQVHK